MERQEPIRGKFHPKWLTLKTYTRLIFMTWLRDTLNVLCNGILSWCFWFKFLNRRVGLLLFWFTVSYMTQNIVCLCADNGAMGIHLYPKRVLQRCFMPLVCPALSLYQCKWCTFKSMFSSRWWENLKHPVPLKPTLQPETAFKTITAIVT